MKKMKMKQSSPLCWKKKNFPTKIHNSDPPPPSPKDVLAFQIALILDIKVALFGRQVVVNKQYKMHFLGLVEFKILPLAVYC